MARSRRSRRRQPLPVGLLLLLLAAGWVYNQFVAEPEPESTPAPTTPGPSTSTPSTPMPRTPGTPPREPQSALRRDVVVRITDGDTVKLQQAGTVRLIGVDTPEKAQPGGSEATAFVTAALLGKSVELEVCSSQPTDRYGRVLGYIYTTDASGRRTLFNSELVRQGFARVYSLRPCTVDEELWNSYYEEARAERRGLFGTLGEVPDAVAYRRGER